ncbi:MAG TPA: VOC family protein [Flavisolibacter sp.]|jgi:catechol 2,3-dioxygenase-like lactoylglutathione lyase family enzyme|nr:VOC family protein [Flavisolibacter sp.]
MESTGIKLLQGIDTVIVRVSNIATSKEWYVKKLGLGLLFEDDKMKLVVLDTKGPTSLTLWQTDKTVSVNKDTASYPIFKTPDADALKQELSNRGVQVGEITQDAYVKYFFFYDPDGNILEACQVHD